MSKEEGKIKVEMPVTGLFGELGSGQEVDSHVITADLMSSKSDLGMKAIINCPDELTVVKMLAIDAKQEGLNEIEELYLDFIQEYRINQCAKGGERSKQIERMVVADVGRSKAESESNVDRLVGKLRK